MRLPQALLRAALVATLAATGVAASSTAAPRVEAAAPPATTSLHLLTNLDGARSGPRAVGYNVFDTGASVAQVNALPTGVRAMVWLGQKCPTWIDDAFRAKVRALAANPKVFGYYLSDEPHIADCPRGPRALASRADFIRKVSGGRQRSFIVLTEGDYSAFRTAATRVSLVGIVAYPCSVKGCDFSKITTKVRRAGSAGVWAPRIVPVYQAFGQQDAPDYTWYLQPTAAQTRTLLATWKRAVPSPVMDYTYGWGNQSSANPTLADTTALQETYRRWFRG